MQHYFVKRDLFGLKAGSVERFAPHKAGPLLVEGMIEPYDEKKHGQAPGAPAQEIREQEAREKKQAASGKR